MMRRIVFALAGLGWFGFVFLVSWWLTFPSDAVAQRIRWEVANRSKGEWTMEVRDVSPWWLGASGKGLRLYHGDPKHPEQTAELRFAAEDTRIRVSPWSLAFKTVKAIGAVSVGEGTVYFSAALGFPEKGDGVEVRDLEVDGPDLPIGDLIAMASESPVDVSGKGSLHVALTAAEGGLRNAEGDVTIKSKDLSLGLGEYENDQLGKINLAQMLGMDAIAVSDVDIDVQFSKGKGVFKKGTINTALGEIEVAGDLTLRDELSRSHLRADVTVTPGTLPPILQAAIPADAKWADGKLHFACTGYLNHPSCRPDHEHGRRNTTSTSGSSASAGPEDVGEVGAPSVGMDEAERERRRQEIQDRLRRRREERAGGAVPVDPPTDKGVNTEEEPLQIEEAPLDIEEQPPMEEPAPDEPPAQ